ncbi:hypothetical protein A2U01_0105097 [Trifolium medium]|uniref:Uncharacterized protein n=1 Tax=Trifolium medium TaxID=97028 RepID=A0A392VA63_9FABA|nr:hypothetical protein [Trifolium medium]
MTSGWSSRADRPLGLLDSPAVEFPSYWALGPVQNSSLTNEGPIWLSHVRIRLVKDALGR